MIITAVVMILLSGCSVNTDTPDNDTYTLSVGVMPSVDAAPIYLADAKGYFTDAGVEVEVRTYTNGTDRETELQTDHVDGVVTDILGLVTNVEAGFAVKATSSTDTAFPVLIYGDSDEKQSVSVGMAEVSVTNYLSDGFLKEYQIEKQFINAISQRMEMVIEGLLDMAIIPEPMASQGELQGLKKVMMTNDDAYSPNILVFRQSVIDDNSEAIKRFYIAYNRAVADINNDDSEARDLLISNLNLNPDIKDLITLPQYQPAQMASEAQATKIALWASKELGVVITTSYSDWVDASLLP